MNQRLLALAAGVCLSGGAHAGYTDFQFTTDAYGAQSDGTRVALGSGDYTVIDLYATASFSSLRLLSLIDMDIDIERGSFKHHDLDPVGNWSAAFTKDSLGAKSAIDSFVTMGDPLGSGDPYAAALDPSFDGSIAGSVSAGAGWYNADPTNGQGNLTYPDLDIFIGRFVLSASESAGNRFSVSGNFAYNFGFPGVEFGDGTAEVLLPGTAVPGPVAAVALAGLGLVRRRRR